MPSIAQSLFEKFKRKLPQATIQLVPGEAFFVRSLPLPPDLQPSEINGFAEISCESLAPFPLDQLAWGYLTHPSSNHLLLYATTYARIKQLGLENLDSWEQVFPTFATAFGLTFNTRTVIALHCRQTLTALWYEPKQAVPLRVHSIPLPADAAEPTQITHLAREWLRTLDTQGYSVDDRLWIAEAPESHRHSLHLHLRHATSPAPLHPPVTFAKSGAALWEVDVRDSLFAAQQQRLRLLSDRLWMVMQAGVSAAVLLLVSQIFSWGWSGFHWYRAKLIAERAPDIAAIEANHDLTNRIADVTERQMKPFAMLESANQGRPPTLYFNRVSSDVWNVLKVSGQAGTLDEVNQYVDRMRNFPHIERVDTDRMLTRNGRPIFDLTFEFDLLPDLEVPPKAPSPESGDATAATTP